jgi:hypothetical protein
MSAEFDGDDDLEPEELSRRIGRIIAGEDRPKEPPKPESPK